MDSNEISSQLNEEENLWGHPKGLYFLAFTEMWERFSFYGMRTLLILYLVQDLLISDRVDQVAGMSAYRNFIESIFGTLSTQAFASQTFGLYSGFVYFTPLLGGLIADRWLGAGKMVLIGIALMTAGHFAMVFDWSLLIALLLIVLGSGCLKGNIATQVGQLYPKAAEASRSRGYAIYSTGINVGGVAGPLICGVLAQFYGWHVGFGAAGVMMLVAAITYLVGMRHLAHDAPPRRKDESLPPLERTEWDMLLLLVAIICIVTFSNIAFGQLFNVGLIFVSELVSLDVGSFLVPAAWFASAESLSSILIVPVLLVLWRWQASRGKEPDDLAKIAIGAVFMTLSILLLALGSWLAGDGKVSIIFPAIAFCLAGIAFMFHAPTLLALMSRHAPKQIAGLMMASAYLTAFFSEVVSGFTARWYEPLGPTAFWIFQSVTPLMTLLLVILFGGTLRRKMNVLGESAE